ncbi:MULTISPECIES: RT0821/Lpp0805 family surface protein [Rhizobium]|uniref:RT0821/Lpp0805 family surface protein n=1 Tax=Rhizobium TaxID=379 RepID=UPI000462AAF8|nr:MULTISPECIES: RT0821/Lpp0805 family surface protein [Rhizobium]MCA0803013.1 hypothetical protein [Rhizobium sp. T1473]MCS0461420.1 hypothetical protein [Rhizobium favelukesii]UFS83433.1 hypothetical protein LPB79_14515 [Rhizobium sp. T136]
MTRTNIGVLQLSLLALVLAGCTKVEPLETAAVTQSIPSATKTDQAVIADAVSRGPVGVKPLAWANPSTGSVGVIEEIGVDPESSCRAFVTTQRTLEGETRFKGLACPSGESDWKLGPVR